ncbi:MAG: saccharopine dehydrogenase, partial [Bacteroidetes bacterium]|nr:saccharopine dehydrogenase [Bacteroidota bacterium]
KNATPAQILQLILERKWTLQPEDKDMLVMWHKFDYQIDGQDKRAESYMVALGNDVTNTAMSKTVGLPVGIATKLILQGIINLTGVQVPVIKEIYSPVLKEMEEFGITFKEKFFELSRE